MKNFIKNIICLTIALTAITAAAQPTIVLLTVTTQDYNPFMPWQKMKPYTRYGYGIAIDSRRILAPEHIVRNANLIELRLPRSADKINAQLVVSDHNRDMAILKAEKELPGYEEGSFTLAESVPKDAELTIYQLDSTLELQSGKGNIIQVSVERLPYSSGSALAYDLLTEMPVSGEGVPAMYSNKVAGIALSSSGADSIQILPYSEIKIFLDDYNNTPYKGVASAGFRWKSLIDPAKREYLGLGDDDRGIIVLSSIPESGADAVLKPGDVIVNWGGYDIDKLGFYEDPVFGRLAMTYAIKGRTAPGDEIELTIIRDKKEQKVKLRLSYRSDEEALIPENLTAEREEFLISGGFMIRELSGRYIRAHGGSWEHYIGISLAYTYNTMQFAPEKKGDRVVILAGVLPDHFNIGYQQFRNIAIEKINGREIRNMKDVFAAVDAEGGLHSVKLKSIEVELVLDKDGLEACDKRLSSLYRIPYLRYEKNMMEM